MGSALFERTPSREDETSFETDDKDQGTLFVPSEDERQDDSEDNSISNASTSFHDGSLSVKSQGASSNDDFGTRRGERAIWCSRGLFFFVLIAAAAALSTVVFVVLKNEENQDFEAELQNIGDEFILLSNHNVKGVFGTLQALSTSATSLVKSQHQETGYPAGFMTMPDVHDQLLAARNATGSLVISYMPQVESADYDLWIEYSEQYKGWISDAANTTKEATIRPYIWEYFEPGEDGYRRRSLASCSAERRRTEEKVLKPSNPLNGPFSPVWTMSPVPDVDDAGIINYNLVDRPVYKRAVTHITETRLPVFLDVCDQSSWFEVEGNEDILQTVVAFPVFSNFEESAALAGVFIAIVPWENFFSNNLVNDTEPIMLVVSNTCDETFSFEVNGQKATFLAEEDLHDQQYDHLAIEGPFADLYNPAEDTDGSEHCVYTMKVYPTQAFEDSYKTNEPLIFSMGVLAIFMFTTLIFLVFDCLVQRRQNVLLNTARKQNAIVSSLFPKSIQQKLMGESKGDEEDLKKNGERKKAGKAGLRVFLNNKEDEKAEETGTEQPIADLFPETTIMFGDIVNFTAWSSAREPSQVFALLEAVYAEFDILAKRRRVFKVEVVGDCYVAVAGLPDPRSDHAVVMAKFAKDCMYKMREVTHRLEIKLGPDTADLKLRVGLHSGPVVAGVLRGDRSRFQLFGDTMNTASRMESTSHADTIQLSQETADLVIAFGKAHWVVQRKDKIEAKGKGLLQTYFLETNKMSRPYSSGRSATSASECASGFELDNVEMEEKRSRSSEWTVEIMAHHLKAMINARTSKKVNPDPQGKIEELEMQSFSAFGPQGKSAIDEVAETISFPESKSGGKGLDVNETELEPIVYDELRSYVQTIAALYNENPFHNFDHATHVAMSVNKLLSRINAPDLDESSSEDVHDHTYGVGSDPLTWFACVFSALIHDVDHSGVPNAQLVKEGSPVAELYRNKSVAEQNSFDMAWDLLMESSYQNLRRTIYVTQEEYHRFRQLVVNGVMATDIVDKDLKGLRNKRWDVAFDPLQGIGPHGIKLKATIIIEHLIQASDVAHTMQHWAIYRKWNEKFYRECYKAYKQGRAENDPTDGWYKGELGFFDFYIIPLAKKLKECGVFGVSSDEYLLYAQQNRMEWEERGEQLVKEMAARAQKDFGA